MRRTVFELAVQRHFISYLYSVSFSSSRIATSNNSSNGCSSGSSSNVTSGNSSPIASETAASAEAKDSKEENALKTKADSNLKGKVDVNSGKNKVENASTGKLRNDTEEEGKTNILDTRATPDLHNKDPLPAVELHPRKRKLKSKPEMNHAESDHSAAFGSIPHPHEVPVTNCYQMFMDIRRQVRPQFSVILMQRYIDHLVRVRFSRCEATRRAAAECEWKTS